MKDRLKAVTSYFEQNFPPNNVVIRKGITVLNGKEFLLINFARFKESQDVLYLEQMEEFLEAVKKIKE